MIRNTPNVRRIRLVAERLGPILNRFVFLGGAVTELLVTDPAAPPPRPTLDVDVVVEIGTRGEYIELQEQLRRRGFSEDMSEGAPICRWKCDSVLVDVMPTDEEMLGFSNRWYPLASQLAERVAIDESTTIRIITAPCFLATKIEAFLDRGNDDYVVSHDLEDVIAVIDGRESLLAEVDRGDPQVRRYLSLEIRRFLSETAFSDAVAGHLPSDPASQARLPLVSERLRKIVALDGYGPGGDRRPAGRLRNRRVVRLERAFPLAVWFASGEVCPRWGIVKGTPRVRTTRCHSLDRFRHVPDR